MAEGLKGIPVFRPGFGEQELEAVRQVFGSGWLGPGPESVSFEEEFASYVGSDQAISVASGTAALHLVCRALQLRAEDEVLIPSLTFVSTAHVVRYVGATPVFVDVQEESGTLDPEDLARKVSSRSRAVIVVHYGGLPCDMQEVWAIAEKHGLAVVEDAAHACGAEYQGRRVGGLSRSVATCFSFNALKNLSTGDGGMVATSDPQVAETVRRLRWMGIEKNTFERTVGAEEGKDPIEATEKYDWFYEVRDLGYKYVMNDILAAIGRIQLQRMDEMQDRRRRMARHYRDGLENVSWLDLPVSKPDRVSAWHLFAVRTREQKRLRRHLGDHGIATSVHYYPLHLQPYYESLGNWRLPVSESLAKRLVSLPFHPNLRDEEVDRVIDAVRSCTPAAGS